MEKEAEGLDWEQTLFTTILHAGNARSAAREAVERAVAGEWEEAERLLKEADDEQVKAHQMEAKILHTEARGEQVPFSILLVHALDLVILAGIEIDNAKELLKLHRRVAALESEVRSDPDR